MPVSNANVAALLSEIADLLEVENANRFRVRAYRNAARTVAELGQDVRNLADRPDALDALPGIGQDLAGKISDLLHTGTCPQLERLRRRLPSGIVALLKVPGLGPRRVNLLHRQLGVASLPQLRRMAQQKRIRQLPGFGPRSEYRILQASSALLQQDLRHPRSVVQPLADTLCADLAALPGVQRVLAAGSLRRGRDTVGDLDLLVTCESPRRVMDHLCSRSAVQRVLERGVTRSSVLLRKPGLQVDLRAVAPASYGAAAIYFTGSKAHNIALRQLAREHGLRLNEYGLFGGRTRTRADTEAAVYAALGLPYIEPELRENRGEIAAAQAQQLPQLLERRQLRGDLHCHSSDGAGHDTLEQLAAAAQMQGLHYLAITDRCSHVASAQTLNASGLAQQMDRIDAYNASHAGAVLLKGAEVEILRDGSLSLPDAALARLDLVVAAVHEGFGLDGAQQTLRLLRAMDRPSFSLLAHPTGRRIPMRAAMALDLARVLRHARERGCFVELNARPERLDLDDIGCSAARQAGVLVSINADARRGSELQYLALGVTQARRGWLQPADVLNTRTLKQLRALLAPTMPRSA